MAEKQSDFNIFERILQSFITSTLTGLFLFGIPISVLICYLLYYSSFWPLLVIYLLWVYLIDIDTPKKLGRKFQWQRHLKIFKYARDYLSGKVINTHDLDPKNNYIICNHPHGIMAAGLFFAFGSELEHFSQRFPGMDYFLASLNCMLYVPFAREYYMGYGMCSVSKESLLNILDKPSGGNIAVIVVGGAEEAFNAIPGESTLRLKKRYGFVKLALQTGSLLVPAYTFGENELYKQVSSPPGSLLRRIQGFLKKYIKVALVIPYGRFLWLPFKTEITTIIGEPLEVPKIENPSEKDLIYYHEKYIDKLTQLFNENKAKYSQYPNAVLKIR